MPERLFTRLPIFSPRSTALTALLSIGSVFAATVFGSLDFGATRTVKASAEFTF